MTRRFNPRMLDGSQILARLCCLAATVALCTCVPTLFEGDDPGECSDGADNDADGTYDCEDPDCFLAPVCEDNSYPTEVNLFDDMVQGEAQLVALCNRLAADNVVSVVRDAFCSDPRPQVTNSQQLLAVLGLAFNGPVGAEAQLNLGNGNPGWSLVGHSASLSRRLVSPVNPRAVIHTTATTYLEGVPGFVALAFVRGEGFAEIITHDPVRDEVDFFLFKFTYRCADRARCSDEERFSEQYESGWLDYTVYGEQDISNTVLDCLQCHQSGLRISPSSRKSPLMFQLNSMWMHWMYDNQYFYNWTENIMGPGPFHEMLQQYVAAHATDDEPLGETFAGIPGGAVYGSRPKSLEDLIEGSGFGNGFDVTAYDPNGASNGLLEDHRARGMFAGYAWEEMIELNLNGLMITPPARGAAPFDGEKLADLIEAYSAYRNGATATFPDVTDIYPDGGLAAVGLRVQSGLTAPEILVAACSQCHHDGLDPTLSRAVFTLGSPAYLNPGSLEPDYFSRLDFVQLQLARERINLPQDHLRAMPPYRMRTLDGAERALVTAWLDTLIAGLSAEDDGEPPLPLRAAFDSPPSSIRPQEELFAAMMQSDMPRVQLSVATMHALPGTDPTGYVEYFFEETSGSPGATSSGWQLSPRYLDTGLILGETYTYRVKMRDRYRNEGEFSPQSSFTLERTWPDCEPFPMDSDCDKLLDIDEFDGDSDGDGIIDLYDTDDDGDGISTQTEVEDAALYGQDINGDGVPNWLDLNSDGDVFTDMAEGPGFLAGNSTPGYLNPNDPCGDTNCSTDPGPMQESCEICPTDCGPCE